MCLFVGCISMFAFDILQIPCGCIQLCRGCTAPRCNSVATDLLLILSKQWTYMFLLILTVTIISLHNINRLAFEMASSSVLGNGAMGVWSIRKYTKCRRLSFSISNSNCDFRKDNLPIMCKKSRITYGLAMKTAFSKIRLHRLTQYAIVFIKF